MSKIRSPEERLRTILEGLAAERSEAERTANRLNIAPLTGHAYPAETPADFFLNLILPDIEADTVDRFAGTETEKLRAFQGGKTSVPTAEELRDILDRAWRERRVREKRRFINNLPRQSGGDLTVESSKKLNKQRAIWRAEESGHWMR